MELNIIEQVLKLLKIRHTHFYTCLYYETYPEHNNLYGLSKILSQYNIKSTALKLNRPIDIYKLNVPFIAYAEHNFVIVKRIHSNKITYIINSIEKINSIDEFIKICSGIVLILEKTSKSVEPNYIEHLKNTILYNLFKTFLICFGLIISYYIYKTNNIDSNNLYYSLLMLLINILGIYVCYLIYCNYHHLKNSQMNRICSMIKKSNCKIIFNRENIFHLIDLSEIGLSYFITNLIIILLIPSFYNNLSFINLLTLPFSLWSFYYQKYRAKNWCTLCIVSQIILWIIFLLNILFNKISLYMWNFKDIIFTIFLWISILSFIIIFISPLITIFNKLKISTYKLNSLKAQEGIFSSLLNKEKKFVFIKSSSIFIGETKAENILTVFSNPYCYPCAKLHKRILNFITHNENVKIQYIFTCFDDKSSIASKCIISAFFNSKTKERNNVIAQWYKYGKNDIVRFCKNYNVDINDKRVLEEFQKQKEWSDASKLKFTPTILFNGNIMPDIYDIEDLNYLI